MKIFPVVIKKIIAAAGGAPTFIYNELRRLADTIKLTLLLQEGRALADRVALTLTLREATTRADRYLIPSVTTLFPEAEKRADLATFTVGPITAVSRSGTPDADDWGDAWTNTTIGQTGVNHGNENPLTTAQLLAATLQVIYFKVNLTKFTNLTAVGNAHTFTFAVTVNGGAATQPSVFACKGQTGNPFTESTITQANQPAAPTDITRAITIAVGLATYTVTFTDAEMQQLLGKWMLGTITVNLLGTGYGVSSREDATTGNRMTLTFKATR